MFKALSVQLILELKGTSLAVAGAAGHVTKSSQAALAEA